MQEVRRGRPQRLRTASTARSRLQRRVVAQHREAPSSKEGLLSSQGPRSGSRKNCSSRQNQPSPPAPRSPPCALVVLLDPAREWSLALPSMIIITLSGHIIGVDRRMGCMSSGRGTCHPKTEVSVASRPRSLVRQRLSDSRSPGGPRPGGGRLRVPSTPAASPAARHTSSTRQAANTNRLRAGALQVSVSDQE